MDYNAFQVMGHLTRDPDLGHVKNGELAVFEIGLAVANARGRREERGPSQ